jgi:hypothetical protein
MYLIQHTDVAAYELVWLTSNTYSRSQKQIPLSATMLCESMQSCPNLYVKLREEDWSLAENYVASQPSS